MAVKCNIEVIFKILFYIEEEMPNTIGYQKKFNFV